MKSSTLLFVSHDPKEIMTMRAIRESLRCRIVFASRIEQAIRELTERRDLNGVIIDLDQALDGLALLGAVHRCQPQLRLGVMVPRGGRGLFELAFLRGATTLLEKPVSASGLSPGLPCLCQNSAGQQAIHLSNRHWPVPPLGIRGRVQPKHWGHR